MKVSDLRNSKYLKKEDCDPPMQGTVKAVTQESMTNDSGEVQRWVAWFKEHQKGCVLNVTRGEQIAEITGSDDSDDWTGARVELFCDPNVRMGGKKVGGIGIRRPSAADTVMAEDLADDVDW
jgi:hypothetical protein